MITFDQLWALVIFCSCVSLPVWIATRGGPKDKHKYRKCRRKRVAFQKKF